jgi:hypothetical protein
MTVAYSRTLIKRKLEQEHEGKGSGWNVQSVTASEATRTAALGGIYCVGNYRGICGGMILLVKLLGYPAV